MTMRTSGLLLFALLLNGCDAADTPAVKDVRVSKWHESGDDTILDGACGSAPRRIWTSVISRSDASKGEPLTLVPGYDLRYTIDIPLLERVADDLSVMDAEKKAAPFGPMRRHRSLLKISLVMIGQSLQGGPVVVAQVPLTLPRRSLRQKLA
jgi:hypothetical protein